MISPRKWHLKTLICSFFELAVESTVLSIATNPVFVIGHVNVGFSSGEKKSPGPHSSKKQWPSTDSDPPAYNEAVREEGDGMDIDMVGPESEEERIMLVVGDTLLF